MLMTIVFLQKIRSIERAKEDGNNAFRNQNYDEAIALYTAGLAIDPLADTLNAVLYSNRAAAYLSVRW